MRTGTFLHGIFLFASIGCIWLRIWLPSLLSSFSPESRLCQQISFIHQVATNRHERGKDSNSLFQNSQCRSIGDLFQNGQYAQSIDSIDLDPRCQHSLFRVYPMHFEWHQQARPLLSTPADIDIDAVASSEVIPWKQELHDLFSSSSSLFVQSSMKESIKNQKSTTKDDATLSSAPWMEIFQRVCVVITSSETTWSRWEAQKSSWLSFFPDWMVVVDARARDQGRCDDPSSGVYCVPQEWLQDSGSLVDAQWRFVSTIRLAWSHRPNREFYLVIDDDVFVNPMSLARKLARDVFSLPEHARLQGIWGSAETIENGGRFDRELLYTGMLVGQEVFRSLADPAFASTCLSSLKPEAKSRRLDWYPISPGFFNGDHFFTFCGYKIRKFQRFQTYSNANIGFLYSLPFEERKRKRFLSTYRPSLSLIHKITTRYEHSFLLEWSMWGEFQICLSLESSLYSYEKKDIPRRHTS